MAAPHQRQDEALTAAAHVPSLAEAPAHRWRARWFRPVLWTSLTAIAAGYMLVGSIRIGAGNWTGRRMGTGEIWRSYLDFIGDLGASPAVQIAIAAAATLTLVCSGWALWLALSLRDRGEAPPDDVA